MDCTLKVAGVQMMEEVVVKALEDGLQCDWLDRGSDTRFHHSEKRDQNELMIAQFTEHTSAVKIRGKAVIQTSHGDTTNE